MVVPVADAAPDATAEVRTSAAGEEPSKDTLKLVNVNGTWKIASLGS
jgi:hypothetical protein